MNISRNVTKRPFDETTIHEETFPAAEKILSDIENVVKKDLELTSFEIIPIQDSENKSPVYHEEHSLGLASWCVQPLYCYAYGRLVDLRRCEHRREESSTISRWLMGALLLNPDVTTFWNMKRELVKNDRLDAIDELRFAAIVLYYKAKCFEAFAYRRWIIQYLLANDEKSCRDIESLLLNEIRIADISADRYANNYHAWSHREYAVTCCDKIMTDNYGNFLRREWENSGKWCKRHVSDHSGLAYRQFLLNRLIQLKPDRDDSAIQRIVERREFVKSMISSIVRNNERSNVEENESWKLLNILHGTRVTRRDDVDYDRTLVALSYWAEDCQNNENDIISYPGHEALWYHRRFLAHALERLEISYRRQSSYELCDVSLHSVNGDFDSPVDDGKSIVVEASSGERGLLSDIFCRDNERIVKISQNSRHETETRLSEKFVRYMVKFGYDEAKEEEILTS